MDMIMDTEKPGKKVILQKKEIEYSLKRIAAEIIENNADNAENVVLIGIRTGGAYLAKRLQTILRGLAGHEFQTGILDISLYRDDWTRIGPSPKIGKTEIKFSIDDKKVILIDDVLFTGRTIRAAMDALMDLGRPKKIELVALVDRGNKYRELPIQANYLGGVWKIATDETINVYLEEAGYEDHVAIEANEGAR
jgi:pyrimidine operon attenuation protein/uracil phosphoribosyltransferase